MDSVLNLQTYPVLKFKFLEERESGKDIQFLSITSVAVCNGAIVSSISAFVC